MANVLTVVWFVIGCVVFHTAILVWAALMLPNPVERARQRVERRPYPSFFLGLLFFGASLLVGVTMLSAGRHGLVQLLGWIVMGPMLASAVVGAAGFAKLVSSRIRPQMKSEAPLPALVAGSLCVALPGWLPVIGWFVFLPLTGLISVGAGLMAILSKREVAVLPAPVTAWPSAAQYPQSEFTIPAPAYTEQS